MCELERTNHILATAVNLLLDKIKLVNYNSFRKYLASESY